MNPIRIVIDGQPVAQARTGSSRWVDKATGEWKGVRFDPEKSRTWKDDARFLARQAMADRVPLQGPLLLSIQIMRKIPTSMTKRARLGIATGRTRPTTKPDLDNYIVAAMNCLKGVVYYDDAQVVGYKEPTGKWFSEKPQVVIEVFPLDPVEIEADAKDLPLFKDAT